MLTNLTLSSEYKDRINKTHIQNVIYKISCNDCDALYVGQTKRQLTTRLKKHKSNIRYDPSKHIVITQHTLENNHNFD